MRSIVYVNVIWLIIASVDGIWDIWSNWTECSHSCGTGERQRYRDCIGPFYGGANCTGPDMEPEPCNTHECPGQFV